MTPQSLIPEKLLENAVTSIRLGVEDFVRTHGENGDAGRALSAVRNIFSGLLLLFKYSLVQRAKSAEEGAKLIFNVGEVGPTVDEDGGVVWVPNKYKSTTIDVEGVRARFKAVGIETDWAAITKLQQERNHIEHLYAQAGAGAIGQFVADMFPILQDFITGEIGQAPADLLGPTWQTMLGHKEFFDKRLHECQEAWVKSTPPGDVLELIQESACESCGSPLIKPDEEDFESTDWHHGVQYVCENCGHKDDAIELLEEKLVEVEGGYNPFDGDDPPTDECPECGHATFVHSKGECVWCGYTLQNTECAVCGEALGLQDQPFGRLCGYHRWQAEKCRDE